MEWNFVEHRYLKPFVLLLFCSALFPTCARSQDLPPASRLGDLQIGAGYSSANANYEYVHNRIAGLYVYTDFDFKEHFGVEASFHPLHDPKSAVYQRTYEIGGRYVRHYTIAGLTLHPYAKLQVGRGILNFPKYANLAYNMVSTGGGVDFSVHPRINVRAEFEYQDWLSAPGPGLNMTPTIISIGVAYHFDGGRPEKSRH
jgi:hypothetical protein